MSDINGLVGVVRRSGLGLNRGRGFVDGDGLLGSSLQCIAVSLNRRELEGTTFALGSVPGHLVEVLGSDLFARVDGLAIDLERACGKASDCDCRRLVGRSRPFEDFLGNLGVGRVMCDADRLVGLVGGRSIDRRLSRLVDGAARLNIGSTRMLLASRIRFDNGTTGIGAAGVGVALVGVATRRVVLRGVGFVCAAIGAVLFTFRRIASLVAAFGSFLIFAAGLAFVVLSLGRAGATLLRVLSRVGGRSRRVLDVGRFGQRHLAFFGVGDGLGIGVIAVDSLIGDLAALVQVSVPGQFGSVGLVDDRAFDHGLSVQQQRRLIAFVFDDELAERGACSFVELHGAITFRIVAVADDGVGLGIGAFSGVLAQPGTVGSQLAIQDFLLSSLVAVTSCRCFGKGLVAVILTQGTEQILVQPGLFCGTVDGHQLAAQLHGHLLGFCQSDGLASVDDFIGTVVVIVDDAGVGVLGALGAEDASDLDELGFAAIGTGSLEEVGKLGQVGDAVSGNRRCLGSATSRGGLAEVLDRGGVNLGLLGRFLLGRLGRLFLGRFGGFGVLGRLAGFSRLGVLGRLLGGRGSRLLAALVLSGLLGVVLGDRLAAGATAAATAGCGGHGSNAHHAGTNGQRADGGGGTGSTCGACGTGFGNRSFTAHGAQRAFGSSGCVGGGHAPFGGGLCHHFLHGFGLFGLGHLVQLGLVGCLLGHLGGVSGGRLGGLACSGAALGGLGFCRAVLSCHIDLRTLKVSR